MEEPKSFKESWTDAMSQEKPISRDDFAALINGIEYGKPIPPELLEKAKKDGIIIVYVSDDDDASIPLITVTGAISVVITGQEIFGIDAAGLAEKENATVIALRYGHNDENQKNWAFETELDHATFEVKEDGVIHCRGIVFYLEDL